MYIQSRDTDAPFVDGTATVRVMLPFVGTGPSPVDESALATTVPAITERSINRRHVYTKQTASTRTGGVGAVDLDGRRDGLGRVRAVVHHHQRDVRGGLDRGAAGPVSD